MDSREFKDAVFGHFARVGASLGNAKRVEIVDVLAQGERSVEDLAREVGASLSNTSRNLQVLANAGLVTRRVEGTSRIYRLADESVLIAYHALVGVAQSRIAEVKALANSFFGEADGAQPMRMADLQEAQELNDGLLLIDVRPTTEYNSGHVPGAVNVPVAELAERMADLPKDSHVVAYCRGPYCVMAATAVRQLREAGFPAARLEIGYPDWLLSQTAGESQQEGTRA
ncbi:MAG TPA: metalloregulator ArsR/SmtB family transcription factor [Actinomycetaceae bacterium]|nr:metalloregulator ArsR/SmtB family transcription factor [Actinomycetaceae bacterium]